MRYFIRVINGEPLGHPIVEDNFKQAFPDIDVDNLPDEFFEFIREQYPDDFMHPYKVFEGSSYELLSDGKYHDVHSFRDMTSEEKAAKKAQVISDWQKSSGYPSFIFDEDTCEMKPPVPAPDDGKAYLWNEELQGYVEVPVAPGE